MPRKKAARPTLPIAPTRLRSHRRFAGYPRRVADEMEAASIRAITIDYQKSLEAAMKALTLWSHGCERRDGGELIRRGASRR